MSVALWVGLSCLHCLQPEAQASARSIMCTLGQSSQVVSTSVLLEGFTYDYGRFVRLVDYLRPNDLVIVYVHAGSRQRKCNFYGGICTATIHRHFDWYLEEYRTDLVGKLPALDYVISKNINLVVIPALEDNYTDEEFVKIAKVTEEVLIGRKVMFARNGLKRHFVGQGWLSERHKTRRTKVFSLTNDGTSIGTKTAEKLKVGPTVFTWWNAKRQGYVSNKPILPSKRKYGVIGASERKKLIKFLNKR